MKKIALVKCHRTDDEWGDDSLRVLDTMWYEVEEAELAELRANLYKLGEYPVVYRLIEYVPEEEYRDALVTLRQIISDEEARRAVEAQRRASRAARTAEEKLEKKRKQLEKLKKELEGT